jgi:hypothetical protein
MSVSLVGNPPFPAKDAEGRMLAKIEHVWHSARRWAKQKGHQYASSYGVIGAAPT